MANPEHLAILKQGVEDWNKWRKEHREVERPDLTRARLRGADLSGAELWGTDLAQADLRGARLYEASLAGADLSNARLSKAFLGDAKLNFAKLVQADLTKAEFPWANLGHADLSGADLGGAYLNVARLKNANLTAAHLAGADFANTILEGANLSGADFTKAIANGTHFADIDLSATLGLETVLHYGPSFIGVETIFKSRGQIPEAFLRGCGVPEEFIAYIGSMVGRPIEFYSCFISYSTKDQDFADRLYADLQSKGVRCWFAPHDIKGGRKMHEQLDEAIRLHDKLLLILSDASMNSDWVGTEIANALQKTHPSNTGLGGAPAREGKQMLFPISIVSYDKVKSWKLFDADRGKDSAREIRQYFIPDFSNWKDHDSYQKAFERLVKDLKADSDSRSAAG